MEYIKTCSQCKAEKPLSDFYIDRGRHASACKACFSKKSKIYRANHKEKIAARKKQSYEDNRESELQKRKDYYAKTKHIQREKWKLRYAESEDMRVCNVNKAKAWQKNNKEKYAEHARNSYLRNIEKRKAYSQRYWRHLIINLDDRYVKSVICAHRSGLKQSDVNESLIEMKRQQLRIQRVVQQLIQTIKENQND